MLLGRNLGHQTLVTACDFQNQRQGEVGRPNCPVTADNAPPCQLSWGRGEEGLKPFRWRSDAWAWRSRSNGITTAAKPPRLPNRSCVCPPTWLQQSRHQCPANGSTDSRREQVGGRGHCREEKDTGAAWCEKWVTWAASLVSPGTNSVRRKRWADK